MPHHHCEFYTANFTRCTRRSTDATDYCRTHQRNGEALGQRPAEGHCCCTRRVQGALMWCGQPHRAGETICEWHWQRTERREERERAALERAAFTEQTLQAYLAEVPQRPWEEVTRHIRGRMHVPREALNHLPEGVAFSVARRYFNVRAPQEVPGTAFTDFWVNLWREERGLPPMADGWNGMGDVLQALGLQVAPAAPAAPAAPPVQPLGQMGRLAADTQNVHTAPVAKQTNSNVELLVAQEPMEDQDTLAWITSWWLQGSTRDPPFETYWRVMEDVRYWYNKRTCKSTSDFLYRKVLDGLVFKIMMTTDMTGEGVGGVVKELLKRLWEECEEAVGMCCEGHISRLANVLVGFDEAFRPPVPVGEILQTKMAAIAEMKLSPKLKLQKAVAVMDELNLPAAERGPWLEALEE
jgi:hypothetical protein